MMEHDPSLDGAGARKPPLATLCAAFDHAVATSPHKVALRHFGVALTYRELGRAVTALAKRLASIVAPGEVMALVLPNSIEFPIAYFATL
jgi:long-chain acyl-CoA synthetase